MDITFEAIEDIKKGQHVKLNFETGELIIVDREDSPAANLIPKEEPNIIEKDDHRLDDLLI